MKKFLAWMLFAIMGRGEKSRSAVDEGLCDFSGQGRNKYGN